MFLQLGRGPLGKGLEHAGAQIEHTPKPVARPGGPIERRGVQGQLGGDLVQQLDRVLGLTVHLIDEGDDGDVAQTADLEQLQGLRLDALGGIQHHDGGIGSGQGAVGVFRKVFVARRVEQIEHQPFMVEGHDAGRDRNAALALDLHPVGAGAPLLAARTHGTGGSDGPASQQQVLGQGGLAGVRVRDDGEGPPTGGLDGGRMGAHDRAIADPSADVTKTQPVSRPQT